MRTRRCGAVAMGFLAAILSGCEGPVRIETALPGLEAPSKPDRIETVPSGLDVYVWRSTDGYVEAGTTPLGWTEQEGTFDFAFVDQKTKRIVYVPLRVKPVPTWYEDEMRRHRRPGIVRASYNEFSSKARPMTDVDWAILNGYVRLGMTKEEVKMACGNVWKTHEWSPEADRKVEAWYYSAGTKNSVSVDYAIHFEKGLVTSFSAPPLGLEEKEHGIAPRSFNGVGDGVSKERLRSLWGDPDHIKSTPTAHGTVEEWVYGKNRIQMSGEGKVCAIRVKER